MPEPQLRIAADLALPLDAVTETFLIFGKKGSGKTATACVLTEELIGAGLPVVILDPMGAWWGLRSSADGNGPGLPVTIFGGEQADLPLPPDAGTAVADLIVEERIPAVLDMFLMSKTQQRKFATDFMERLFRRNRDPLHLVIDESDRFAPQRGTGEMARLLGAYEDVVLRGRRLGIGSTSITLRPAQLHSAIRSQVEVLVAMRMLGKLDVQAIDEWVRLHATDEDAAALKASLPSLPVGAAWFWSPGALDIMARVQVRPRRTFDSSATPKVGQQRIEPREFARVDPAALERLAARLGDTVPATGATADAAEVQQLRGQILRLQRQLAKEREAVRVPVLRDQDLMVLEQSMAGLKEFQAAIWGALDTVQASDPSGGSEAAPAAPAAVQDERTVVLSGPHRVEASPAGVGTATAADAPLKAGARNMLAVLGRLHPRKLTRAQLAAMTRIKVTGTTFSTYLGQVKRAGLVTEADGFVELTPAGFEQSGATPGPVGPAEIRELWDSVLKAGARKMLDVLIDRHPAAVTRDELAATVDIDVKGTTFTTYLGTLRRNSLATETTDGVRAADVFFLEAPGE